LPPALAPTHLVIVPIFKTQEELDAIKQYLAPALEQVEKTELHIESDFL
jgi:hypothetical protein